MKKKNIKIKNINLLLYIQFIHNKDLKKINILKLFFLYSTNFHFIVCNY